MFVGLSVNLSVSLSVCLFTCFSSGGGSNSHVAVEPGSDSEVSSVCDLSVTHALLSLDT